MKQIVFLISALLLFGCSSAAESSRSERNSQIISSVTNTPTIQRVDDSSVTVSVNEINISVKRPQDWEFYTTEYGLVVAESIGAVATNQQIDGLLAHIFIPPVEDFTQSAVDTERVAYSIMMEITRSEEFIHNAVVSEPQAFTWDGEDAAYFLMDNGQGHVTVVLGVVIPGTRTLVTAQISAPDQQANRIRTTLPDLLDGLTIDGRSLSGNTLNTLPDPLDFPEFSS